MGVGLDMPWGGSTGFEQKECRCAPTPNVAKFFKRYHSDFSYYFFSFQPKNKNHLRAEEYFEAYDALVAVEPSSVRAFHHTRLNLGALEPYRKDDIIEFTNEMIRRYDLKWINEDLGIWSVRGHGMPYPLPPFLTGEGLRASIRNTREYQECFEVPLLVEFPGFTEGSNFYIGEMDGFEFFRKLAEETASPVTLDTGHLLSYQWLKGRGDRYLDGLDALPLSQCFEIHLSGCQIRDGRFLDLHHGVLLDEQVELLDFLLTNCPNVKAITYEDPKFSSQGDLIPKAVRNYERVRERVKKWKQTA